MKNKLLLPAMLSLLSGCVSHTTAPVTVGTGGGSAGLGQSTGMPISPAIVPPIALPTPPVSNDKTTDIAVIPAKNTDLEIIIPTQKTEILTVPSPNRYSNNKDKSINSAIPTSAGNPSNYVISGENYRVLPFSNGFVERGIASWYGPDFHGEKTSNGEIYDMYGMTAAHKRLPIPSYVKVTNLKNKRSVVLRINDRGPFFPDRVIDLSYAAAQKLDIHKPGTEMVEIEAIKTSNKESVYLQLGVFSNPANAQLLQKKIVENKMPEPMVKEVMVSGKVAYRVQLGPIFSPAKVDEFHAKLAKIGIFETWYVTENKL
jgi:rare lipoprotein A